MTTNNRFANLEIDDIPAPAPSALARPRAGEARGETAASIAAGLSSGVLDAEGRARAIKADEAMRGAGLIFAEPTFFAWGTRGQWGNAAQRARAELHAMPLVAELAAQAKATVGAEDRKSIVAPVASLRYGADDHLHGIGTPMRCTPQALQQLVGRADGAGGSYLANAPLPGSLRASHVNFWIERFEGRQRVAMSEHAARADERAAAGKPRPAPFEARNAKFLHKLAPESGERHIFGTVGEGFPEHGMDAVLADLLDTLPPAARGTLVYDPGTTRWRAEIAVGAEFEPVVGDVYRMGMKLGSHDAGGGSFWGGDLYGIRVRCVNFTKIFGYAKKRARVRHIGSIDALKARLREMLETGTKAIEAYSDAVRDANTQALVDGAREKGEREIFRALIKGGYLPGADGLDTAVDRYVDAWAKEPGYTRDAYVNAATRAAHEASWSSPWIADEIEEKAGQMLFNRVILTERNFAGAEVR